MPKPLGGLASALSWHMLRLERWLVQVRNSLSTSDLVLVNPSGENMSSSCDLVLVTLKARRHALDMRHSAATFVSKNMLTSCDLVLVT